MIPTAIIYLALGLGITAILTTMILKIGRTMHDCPQNGPTARTLTITTATGFAAIGTGGVLLAGAALPFAGNAVPMALPLVAGFVTLCLGLGFLRAMEAVRDNLPNPAPTAP